MKPFKSIAFSKTLSKVIWNCPSSPSGFAGWKMGCLRAVTLRLSSSSGFVILLPYTSKSIRMTGQMISVTLPSGVRFQLIAFFLESALK